MVCVTDNHYHQPRSEGALFSVMSVYVCVCLFVCLFVRLDVCQHDNSWTVRDIITKFSGHHLVVDTVDRFENGYCGVRRWWEDISDVLFFKDYFRILASTSSRPACVHRSCDDVYCSYGFTVDDQGCPTCNCRDPCSASVLFDNLHSVNSKLFAINDDSDDQYTTDCFVKPIIP